MDGKQVVRGQNFIRVGVQQFWQRSAGEDRMGFEAIILAHYFTNVTYFTMGHTNCVDTPQGANPFSDYKDGVIITNHQTHTQWEQVLNGPK